MSDSAKVKVFLCGEGSNELGSRSGHPAYQSDERPGVLHALLLRVQATGWEVGGARDWKSIPLDVGEPCESGAAGDGGDAPGG